MRNTSPECPFTVVHCDSFPIICNTGHTELNKLIIRQPDPAIFLEQLCTANTYDLKPSGFPYCLSNLLQLDELDQLRKTYKDTGVVVLRLFRGSFVNFS